MTTANKCGQLHCNTKGKLAVSSHAGHTYSHTVVDKYSCFTYMCPMLSVGEAFEVLPCTVGKFENLSDYTVTAVKIYSDCEFRCVRHRFDQDGVDISVTAE